MKKLTSSIFALFIFASIANAARSGEVVEGDYPGDDFYHFGLSFRDIAEGIDPGRFFSGLGVSLNGIHSRLEVVEEPVCGLLIYETILHNIPEDQSNDSILAIDLEYPAEAIGLALGGISEEEVTVQIDFQDQLGRRIGRFEKEIIENVDCDNYYWFQASGNLEISKILIDFHGTREELEGLAVRWVEPPVYRRLVPQVVVGGPLQTTLSITSDGYYSPSRPVRVRFFNEDGTPLTLQIDDTIASEFDLLAMTNRDLSRDFEIINPQDQLVTGYAVLESDSLFAAGVAYAPEGGAKMNLAAVAPRSIMSMPLRKSVKSSQNTGLAFVNSSEEREAEIQIRCILSSSTEPLSVPTDLQLAPGQKKALFADELCTGLPDEFIGYARLESSVPVAATAVETHKGSALAEIPVVSTEKANTTVFPE